MNHTPNALHDTATVIDCLEISNWSESVFQQMRQGGLTAVNCTCSILENFRQTIKNIAWWQKAFNTYPGLIMPVHDTADIRAAKRLNKTGIILGFQNTSAIEDDLDLLGVFHQLGVRVMQLTYMEGNLSGQGCLERFDAGLTNFGKEVIEEMNRLGILIDLSHVGNQTALEAITHSRRPVALTHANPKSLCDHPRNKPDEVIKAVAENGGVVGATIFPPFLPKGNRSALADFIDVIDYMVNMIGIDHVAVGTDFTEGQPREWFDWILTGRSKKGPALQLQHPLVNPKGIQSAADFPNITAALLERGYDELQIRKIMGENMMRIFSQVWKNQGTSSDMASPVSYHHLISRLKLTSEQRLMLDSIPMVLFPRWFFVSIKKQIEKQSDLETARKIYYQAGWEGAVKWTQKHIETEGLSGRALLEQYMNSAGLRGWGKLTIAEYDEQAPRAVIHLTHSAVAEEMGDVGRTVCDHLPGSIAGAFQTILTTSGGSSKKIIGRETKCLANGDDKCVFEITAVD
ncbi:MAG: membrane dipeptidase [Desulfotignum sp.]|nr:membrane dipeptidase [Desulfotignum sp.]MCF8086994.1 membrane dipeptidase [Desulfotignum sp.]MCF8137168.1 membrane dipeptidase [Desulfotignum sp.]